MTAQTLPMNHSMGHHPEFAPGQKEAITKERQPPKNHGAERGVQEGEDDHGGEHRGGRDDRGHAGSSVWRQLLNLHWCLRAKNSGK